MTIESLLPFLLIIAPFAIAFFLEALVIYFFKIKLFWASVGTSILINIISLGVLYVCSLLIGKLGYAFNGLRLPVQVLLALWWISTLSDGILLQVFSRKAPRQTIYLASIVMNTISYLFLYFFITNSH